jgi:hypothetical protein
MERQCFAKITAPLMEVILERSCFGMKLVFTDKLPKRKGGRHNLRELIKEFVSSGNKIAKVDLKPNEYKSPLVARNCMYISVKRSGENVRVSLRDGEVYLIKE